MSPTDELLHLVQSTRLLTPSQVQDILVGFAGTPVTPDAFLQAGVRLGLFTKMQVDKLKNGDTTGYIFGDYKALYMVGAGTFARVFRAVNVDTQQVVAVKVLRGRFSDNKEFIKHFLHEAQLGQQIVHPNIVPIYGASSEGLIHFMAMEFVEGQTLREFVKVRKKVDALVATQIVRDIADGLQYAAKRGLQHRDLKLSNVLLSSSGMAKLVDFGLASIAEQASVNVPFLKNQQSIDYIALERTSGVAKNDNRSDIYFLGCIYYHLLAGTSPFLETKDRAKRLDRNRFFNVRPVQAHEPTVPHAVAQVVEKAMKVQPTQRYQTPAAMLADLERLLAQLKSGEVPLVAHGKPQPVQEDAASPAAVVAPTPTRGTVMVVDSHAEMQDALRTSFRKHGFRVLVVADAERAIMRLRDEPTLVDCVMFNATSLGIKGVRAFNEVAADHSRATPLPAILILAESQNDYKAEAVTSERHVVLQMPVKMKQLRDTVAALLEE
ncbi:MAG: protein kinase domain-containing protein [Thermoguttaceae bacterium]